MDECRPSSRGGMGLLQFYSTKTVYYKSASIHSFTKSSKFQRERTFFYETNTITPTLHSIPYNPPHTIQLTPTPIPLNNNPIPIPTIPPIPSHISNTPINQQILQKGEFSPFAVSILSPRDSISPNRSSLCSVCSETTLRQLRILVSSGEYSRWFCPGDRSVATYHYMRSVRRARGSEGSRRSRPRSSSRRVVHWARAAGRRVGGRQWPWWVRISMQGRNCRQRSQRKSLSPGCSLQTPRQSASGSSAGGAGGGGGRRSCWTRSLRRLGVVRECASLKFCSCWGLMARRKGRSRWWDCSTLRKRILRVGAGGRAGLFSLGRRVSRGCFCGRERLKGVSRVWGVSLRRPWEGVRSVFLQLLERRSVLESSCRPPTQYMSPSILFQKQFGCHSVIGRWGAVPTGWGEGFSRGKGGGRGLGWRIEDH